MEALAACRSPEVPLGFGDLVVSQLNWLSLLFSFFFLFLFIVVACSRKIFFFSSINSTVPKFILSTPHSLSEKLFRVLYAEGSPGL